MTENPSYEENVHRVERLKNEMKKVDLALCSDRQGGSTPRVKQPTVEMVGKYRLTRTLGQGAYGRVKCKSLLRINSVTGIANSFNFLNCALLKLISGD